MSTSEKTPENNGPMLEQFSVPDLDQWKEEVERLLKGAPFAKKMFTKTLEGITVNPMYTGANDGDLPWSENLPGQAPFLRGSQAAGSRPAAWLVAQELPLPTTEEFNNALRSDLKRGQTAVNLVLDMAGHNGLDPDQADALLVGANGTSIASMADLEVAFDGVDLTSTPVFVQTGSAALPFAALLKAMLDKSGKDSAELCGCLGSDPVFGLAELGQLPLELARIYDELAIISRWAAGHAPALKTLPVHEDPWHDGGADSALSLGLTLASAVQSLRAMEERGLDVGVAASQIQFQLCIGSDFFMEMAKVRAIRILWSDVLDAGGCQDVAATMKIHARTSRRTQTLLDPHVNLLRVTTQAMSAVLGGVDSLHVSPFDEVDSLPDEFSRRIARNVQLVLSHECHFCQVQDPAGGSWYVENLTAKLAEKAWEIFQEVEAAGGIIKAMESGWVQGKVAAAAELRRSRLATRQDVLVGTNQYANLAEKQREIRSVDRDDLKARRTEAMKRLRTSGAQDEHMLVLGRLEKIMEAQGKDLLPLLVDAATHGATLGELTSILRHDTDTDLNVQTIPLRRDSLPFENLRQRVAGIGERGRVFAACLGDVARYMPRLDFTRGFFQVGGFEVVENGFFTAADDAVKAAAKSGAPIVVLVALDDTYIELAAETLDKLKAMAPPPLVVVAGGSADLLADLKTRGLDLSINARSNILDVLGELAKGLEVQS
jgi:methylmalonyl-CoA mutase